MIRSAEEGRAEAAAYLASTEYQKAWARLTVALESWTWGICDYEVPHLTARFVCGPFPAQFDHSIDLGTPEKFEFQTDWCARMLILTTILDGVPWLSWWSRRHKRARTPFGYDSHPSEFREALASGVFDAVKPQIKEHPGFKHGMAELFDLVTSDAVAAICREHLVEYGEARLWSAVGALRRAGKSDAQIREALDVQMLREGQDEGEE